MTRALLAWLAFTAGCIFVTVDIVRLNITGLFLAGAGLLIFWAWGIGAFRRDFWIEDIDSTHPDALGSLNIRDGLTQPPTGDAAFPSADAPNVPASPVGSRP